MSIQEDSSAGSDISVGLPDITVKRTGTARKCLKRTKKILEEIKVHTSNYYSLVRIPYNHVSVDHVFLSLLCNIIESTS